MSRPTAASGGWPPEALIDYHIHTTFSEDSRAQPEECARVAAERGLGGIIFTEHLEFPPPADAAEPAYVPERVLPLREYARAVEVLRETWEGRLKIGLGLELGLEPHNLESFGPYLAAHRPRLDYVLGSLHTIGGTLVQFPEYTDPLGPKAAADLYFERLLAGLQRAVELGAVDVIGHVDLVKRSPTFGVFRLADHRPHLEKVLRTIIDAGVGLEVNTSGYRQAPGEPYPGLETLALYRELRGEIVTVGSDSHRPSTVGGESARALEFIKAAGFDHVTLFSDRRPRFAAV